MANTTQKSKKREKGKGSLSHQGRIVATALSLLVFIALPAIATVPSPGSGLDNHPLNGNIKSSVTIDTGSTYDVPSGDTLDGDTTVEGTLGGRGTVQGNVTVENQGTLYPGDPSITTVNGSVNLTTGSTATFSIADSATPSSPRLVSPGVDYDQISIQDTGSTSNLTIQSGVTLEILNPGFLRYNSVAYVPTGTNATLYNYFLVELQTGVTTGQFDTLSDGTNTTSIAYDNGIGTAILDTTIFHVSYTGDFDSNTTTGGHDVVLSAYSTVTPEPDSCLLFIFGACFLAILTYHRRSPA